ncbi:MAG: 3'(2'),5'-bisphosphate nucleotidase CysQ [Siculibacillus sp.]|nr:3'(2'),5'-bisphosphate nucleotidase CysQ [Siculibacillus sp.]
MTFDPSLLAALADVALAAGRVVNEVRAGAFAVLRKADASPVTVADEWAERLILTELARLMPGVPVVAEEQVAAGSAPPRLGERFVLVDPLDGTREFVSRNGEFTVNIAVIEDGRPVAGVVHAPALGEIHVGAVGLGAKEGRIGEDGSVDWRDIAVRAVPGEGMTILSSRSHGDARTEALIARLAPARSLAAGSSLKFCRLASGAADLYPRLGRTMEWDTAAGDAVLRAAGGLVVDLDGRPLVYGRPAAEGAVVFANPPFLAAGSRAALDAAAAALG